MLEGRYDKAIKVFPFQAQVDEARRRSEIAGWSARFAKGRRVLQVERIPNAPGRWIVVFAEQQDLKDDGKVFMHIFSRFGFRQFRETPSGLRKVGRELVRPTNNEDSDCTISHHLSISFFEGRPFGVLFRRIPSSGSTPTECMFFRVDSQAFGKPHSLRSAYDVRLVPPDAKHGLRVVVDPTYKVDWSDVYEWRGERFRFANGTSPDLYRPESLHPRVSYAYREAWMNYAARETIAGHRQTAIKAWKRAADLCAASVASGREYPISTWYGTPAECLKAIQRRLRWLRRGEMGHALLYRPYDYDLQVPPYELGTARNKP